MSNNDCCLGIIETMGLSAALEAADTMLKSGKIELAGLHFLGSAQVAVVVKGKVGPVQAAIEAGKTAAERKGKVLSKNVIPRCNKDLMKYLNTLERVGEHRTHDLAADI